MIDEQPDEEFQSTARKRLDTGNTLRNAVVIIGSGNALQASLIVAALRGAVNVRIHNGFDRELTKLTDQFRTMKLTVDDLSDNLRSLWPSEPKQKAQWKTDRRLSNKWGRR